MKKIIIIVVVVILVLLGIYLFTRGSSDTVDLTDDRETGLEVPTDNGDDSDSDEAPVDKTKTVIGASVEERDITAYHYGEGSDELLFVGGVHGGYSWNTVLLAYEMIDYLEDNPEDIPENIKVTVIPVLNPDGLNKTVGTSGRFESDEVPGELSETIPGRFNANEVDLNRNFDCDWQSEGTWQSKTVDAGSAPFSEPEARAFQDYVLNSNPKAVVAWYSSAGGVYASSCHTGLLEEMKEITAVYANASGYPAYEDFDFYEITGDMVNWLAKENIPAISVLLSTHNDTEWSQNKKALRALIEHFSK